MNVTLVLTSVAAKPPTALHGQRQPPQPAPGPARALPAREPAAAPPMKVSVLFCDRATEVSATAVLTAHGIEVVQYRSVGSLLSALRTDRSDALLLEGQAEEVSNRLAMLAFHGGDLMPIIVVGDGGPREMCEALSHGAADYALSREGMDALVRRVLAQISLRGHRQQATSLRVQGYSLETRSQSLVSADGEVTLTSREFALAWVLFEHVNRVVSLNTLSTRIWGRSSDVGKRTIEQHVYKLRRKLIAEAAEGCGSPADGLSIRTVHNVGYRLECRG